MSDAPRRLWVLSPYRIPSQEPLMLGRAEAAALLNAHAVLWHPSLLAEAAEPPRFATTYDHETPQPGHVYAIPAQPAPMLPSGWEARVQEAGARTFIATEDRAATFEAVRAAAPSPLFDLPANVVAPFLGLGFGYLMLGALHEAMEHENLLSVDEFWNHIQDAVRAALSTEPDGARPHLQHAADMLLAAREVIYPVAIHVVDLVFDLEQCPKRAWAHGLPLNFVASGSELERQAAAPSPWFLELRERVGRGAAEVCVGGYLDRADEFLPVESQNWNLAKGLDTARQCVGDAIRVYGSADLTVSPHLAPRVASAGLERIVLARRGSKISPSFASTVVAWTAPDGRQIDALAREPKNAGDPTDFLHLAHALHKTIMQDHAATVVLSHDRNGDDPSYEDWVELSRLAPVLGQWTTVSRYLGDVSAGEYATSLSPDELIDDRHFSDEGETPRDPVSLYARHARARRHIDTLWALAGLLRGITRDRPDGLDTQGLALLEGRVETGDESALAEVTNRLNAIALRIAERVSARGNGNPPGCMVFNPCGFSRRVTLALPSRGMNVDVRGPVKAVQQSGDTLHMVVEVPAFGFASFPTTLSTAAERPAPRMRLADERHVRNEYFEAEIDAATGGLRGIRDPKSRRNRLSGRVVFNPGSRMVASAIRTTSSGPAFGELVAEGVLLDAHERTLARFRASYRAWLGRPVLEMTIELDPLVEPAGYPWHAYYGARFAWQERDLRLARGIDGVASVSSHPRPLSPDFLELRASAGNTVIFPGGMPFHQRHGDRAVDVVLAPAGETARRFELYVALDRAQPALMAQGLATPVRGVAIERGPPTSGATGWFFHMDSAHVLATSLRPAGDGGDGIVAHLHECGGAGATVTMRCPRPPIHAELRNIQGAWIRAAEIEGDGVVFEVFARERVVAHVQFA